MISKIDPNLWLNLNEIIYLNLDDQQGLAIIKFRDSHEKTLPIIDGRKIAKALKEKFYPDVSPALFTRAKELGLIKNG